MADLSQIKVGNVIYDIKDSVARENAAQGGGSLDFKNCYLHVFEYYNITCSPSWDFTIYVPMTTKELQGDSFFKKENVECSYWDINPMIIQGAFVVGTKGVYDGMTSYEHCKIDVFEDWFDEELSTGSYYIAICGESFPQMKFSELTFVREKVI